MKKLLCKLFGHQWEKWWRYLPNENTGHNALWCRKCDTIIKDNNQKTIMPIPLYYHKTDGGAEYLMDTFIQCNNGHKEGTINSKTKYIIRIDGDITKDAELNIK